MAQEAQPKPADEVSDAAASALAAIGVRIREVRRARSMTRQALAEASGLSPTMLSLVERGRASLGSLVVVAKALDMAMSDRLANEPAPEERLVVRAAERPVIGTTRHAIRRLLREGRSRGIAVALNEDGPHARRANRPVAHRGVAYGFVLDGKPTVGVEGAASCAGRAA
ncbi:helix-turn-helix domain-containing protein [Methylobacterium terricola]|uniref:Helix-turn-helix domain-containing protein n=1 Tax=Methylobacterium terricola TaxID=2583531 RepID=A0A5C4L894_9HYPH|nr:helix-turn-helix domain-containing protein [Methylobacterium terricola]TNC08373.1 helix-turn-helix domain-containing protein [Methylobacterium terricola]